MKLYIGNKNYSSWSLRPWLLMKVAGIDFEEMPLRLDFSPGSLFKTTLAAIAPTNKVPVLVEDDGFAVWDTLAIAEYLAEKHPEKALWPVDGRARAHARSLCADMHAGFAELRQHCPMNVEAELPAVGARLLAEVPGVAQDLARIVHLWQASLGQYAGRPAPPATEQGPGQRQGGFLFGEFSIADAYYAPVCLRITTYRLPVPPEIAAYVDRLLALPAMELWMTAARAEHDFIEEDEPYRSRA